MVSFFSDTGCFEALCRRVGGWVCGLEWVIVFFSDRRHQSRACLSSWTLFESVV